MLLAIAQNYAQRGNTSLASEILAQAFAVADTIKDENQRNNVFASAARNLADLSNFPQNLTGETWRYNLAVQIAKPLSQPTTKAEILIQIALKYLIAGEVEASRQTLANALEVAKGIEEQPQWRTKLLEMIEAGMKLEEYDFALQVANAIKDNASKTIVLRQVAQKYAIAGNKEKAVAVLSQAIQVANTIEDESARKQAIEGITQQQKE
jgi:tetratricopeptide (TPR) repeat protein